MTLHSTCFVKMSYYESAMFKKVSKRWRNNQMQYWLLKSEPNVWSIDQQKKAGVKGAAWDGVRNYQAANNLKKMKKGELCFFYHSNINAFTPRDYIVNNFLNLSIIISRSNYCCHKIIY